MSGLGERAEVAHAFGSPELARTFESALPLTASRLDGSGTDGPATTMDGLVVHPDGMSCKIILFTQDYLSSFSFRHWQSGDFGEHFLLASMSQLVTKRFSPPRGGGFIISVKTTPQTPQVFAGMIEVEQFGRAFPAVLRHIPDPGGSIGYDELCAGSAQPAAQSPGLTHLKL
jgi:hypothetical protein